MSNEKADGTESALPTYKNHLPCDAHGNYPAEVNTWEVIIVETEMKLYSTPSAAARTVFKQSR